MPFCPVVTLVIGAFLGPFVTEVFKRPAEKRRVRAELIENLYILSNLNKLHIAQVNQRSFLFAYLDRLFDEINYLNLPPERRGLLINKTAEIQERIKQYMSMDIFEKLTRTEGNICRLQIEIMTYFPKATSRPLTAKVRDLLNFCNEDSAILAFKYDSYTTAQLEHEIGRQINLGVQAKQTELHDKCMPLIEMAKSL